MGAGFFSAAVVVNSSTTNSSLCLLATLCNDARTSLCSVKLYGLECSHVPQPHVHVGAAQVVQLRHVATGKFVTIKRTAADVERGALKVVLEAGGHEGSWFQVFSGYR